MRPTGVHWSRWPRILAEDLRTIADPPLAGLMPPAGRAPPASVARCVALAVLDLDADDPRELAPWLAPHQRPAVRRLVALLRRHGGAVLSDAVGLGKSYVALGVARALAEPCLVIVPAVLARQWRQLLTRLDMVATLLTHESLSGPAPPGRTARPGGGGLVIVDEAHRFRHPDTRRYRALARLVVARHLLLVTATPLHNRHADPLHLLHLFLRDDALAAVGLPSLRLAARRRPDPRLLSSAVARFVVARSRQRAIERGTGPMPGFPRRAAGAVLRALPAPLDVVADLTAAIGALRVDPRAAALLRLLLLSRLASSVPALRATVRRLEAFDAAARDAALQRRGLATADFARWFPVDELGDVQLAFAPLLLAPGHAIGAGADQATLRRIIAASADAPDAKLTALNELLAQRPLKTIVFTAARATATYLARALSRHHRVAVLTGAAGLWGRERVSRGDVLAAFAPVAQGCAPPSLALRTDVLIATDLVSEGLDLQDAARVVHYDLPWSPARLAQRVGRIDRLGSQHGEIETVTFAPAHPLAASLRCEGRLARKLVLQRRAGAAALEAPGGPAPAGTLDWCDRLHAMGELAVPVAPPGAWAHVDAAAPAVVLAIRVGGRGGLTELFLVDDAGCRVDPAAATALWERAVLDGAGRDDPSAHSRMRAALARAMPLVEERLRAVASSRWRTAYRDGVGRRLVAWALAAARRAARARDTHRLAQLDTLVSRLARGMTAGEELLLGDLLERARPLEVDAVLAWHLRLPPLAPEPRGPPAELIAVLLAG